MKGDTMENMWIEEAREQAAQCWCDSKNSHKTMDVDLAESVATKIAFWMETAAQNQRNTDYYRGLLVKCGRIMGKKAYTCDDGSMSEDVLCAKIPELIAEGIMLMGVSKKGEP